MLIVIYFGGEAIYIPRRTRRIVWFVIKRFPVGNFPALYASLTR